MIWGGRAFFNALPHAVVVLIAIGGGLYSMGVVFYLWEKPKWNHLVWHLFVLAAAGCHYVAVLLTVA